MDKRYDPHQHEERIYQLWQDAQAFSPDKNQPKTDQSFTIMMPPPNANDPLHIGHGVFLSVEDIMIRYHRMVGDDTLWLPGTDHAGIETQFVFEKKLKKKGKSRFDFDRESLYSQIWDYVQENSDVAVNQMKKIGTSADWDRFMFMLDDDYVDIVLDTFKQLSEEELLYRDLRLVNYSVKAGTAYSELEVLNEQRTTPLYYLKYGPFELATTRPETKFADTAVAVHPDDKRYQKYIGQEIEVEGLHGPFKLKVIADEFVDPEFGTGVVKITPFHDHNDFEVWQRHMQDMPEPKQIINFNGRMTEVAGKYAGMKVKKAREEVVKDLQAKGLITKIDEKYTNTVKVCYKTGDTIEPLPMAQFFIKVKPLTQPVIKGLEDGSITVHGAGHDKILKHWLENLRDWNISRQVVWGIRMPVWYDVEKNPHLDVTFIDEQGKIQHGKIQAFLSDGISLETISQGLQNLKAPVNAPYEISKTSPGKTYIQETDTFDTWFSSSQWPFATLQALDRKSPDANNFKRFYPTQVLETAYDILPFWVMRMLMMGKYMTGKFPFSDVYLHGLARDQHGRKMSKSKGNVINPLEIIDQYGADALRMALVIRSSAGLDKSVGHPDFKAMRNLTNKLWNATRFIVMMSENKPQIEDENKAQKNAQLFETKLQKVVEDVTQQLNDYKIGLAAETLYNEFWHWFCDICIEDTKSGQLPYDTLVLGLITFLKLLHPFMPFVTEVLWQELRQDDKLADTLPQDEPLLISAAWPVY